MNLRYSQENILHAAKRLAHDIRKLKVESLPVHESVKSYFRFDLGKLDYVSECNAFMLYHCLSDRNEIHPDMVIVDHGAGIGFFALLVCRMGLQCICHDISNEYIEGIKILGQHLDAEPEHFVVGDTHHLITYCTNQRIRPIALASRNVIEHLPDYRSFFKEIHKLSSPGFSMVLTTSANQHNPLVLAIHRKIHHRYEHVGSNTDMDNPTLNTANCGIKIRTKIIQDTFPEIDSENLANLAILTRGYLQNEIIQQVKEFQLTARYPIPIKHPSNTRDPITGAWVERLVAVSEYRKAANEAGFKFETQLGFYNTYYTKFYKNFLTKILNRLLPYLPQTWVALSPFLAMKLSTPNKDSQLSKNIESK